MKRITIIFIGIFILLTLSLRANAQVQLTLRGQIVEAKTRNALPGATVQVLAAKDSAVLGSATMNTLDTRYVNSTSFYEVKIPKQEGKYIIRASFLGFKTAYVNVTIDKLGKREFRKDMPPITLKPDSKMLQDVNVVASKVKFYYKGDTVVYNADAFVLSEGSMLDALVKQLPGVEIRDDGKIYHNGQFVESLLLNGKDFFKGNQQIMLDNLPSYTVKQVKVYDKYGEKSEFLGQKLQNDKQYVIDVNLKKEYNAGSLANIEVGGGTSDRYLGRIFALRYADNSRIGFYGNINNLNDRRKPGENSNWTPESMPKGESKEKQAGLDYFVRSSGGKVSLRGNAQFNMQDQNLLSDVDRVSFLSGGDSYEYERNLDRNKNFSISTSHDITLNMGQVSLSLSPKFNYAKYDNTTAYLSGTFSAMQEGVSRELLEKIYSSDNYTALRKTLVNRYIKEGLRKGNEMSGGLNLFPVIKIKGSDDFIMLNFDIQGNRKKEDRFNRYFIHYGEKGEQGASGYQYFDNQPDKKWKYRAFGCYQYKATQYDYFNFLYTLDHIYQKKNSSLYLLDKLDKWQNQDLGALPSMMDYEAMKDESNSYQSTSYETAHKFELGYELRQRPLGSGIIEAQLAIPLQPMRKKLEYHRGSTDTTLVKHKLFLPISMSANYTSKERANYSLSAEMSYEMPDLKNMVNIKDDTDPLNIHLGNSGLRGQTTYFIFFNASKSNPKTGVYKVLSLTYQYLQDAFAMGYSYDSQTGVRTYRADNVNGNWTGTATFTYNTPLDKQRRLTLNTQTRGQVANSVDLAGRSMSGDYYAVRSSVHSFIINEKMGLNYKMASTSTIGLKLNGTWRDLNSSREDFQHISAWDVQYGVTGTFQLLKNLHFSTDLTMYTRRGYEGSSMNTDDLVWNARLSYTMLKGKLTWMLDGFDILNQLNNVTRVVNAQGRTETYTNALPRYALLHVAYKFNAKPKKK